MPRSLPFSVAMRREGVIPLDRGTGLFNVPIQGLQVQTKQGHKKEMAIPPPATDHRHVNGHGSRMMCHFIGWGGMHTVCQSVVMKPHCTVLVRSLGALDLILDVVKMKMMVNLESLNHVIR